MIFNLTVLLAITGAVLSSGPANHRGRRSWAGSKLEARADEPANIAKGAATTDQGCTQYYTIVKGDYCYKITKKFGLTLTQFYDMNKALSNSCGNLYLGKSYCVSKKAGSAPTKGSSGTDNKPPTSTTKPVETKKPFNPDNGGGNVLAAAGINKFLDRNENSIFSWFDTNYHGDDTNGRSWCEFSYYNNDPGFAPPVMAMRENFGWNNNAAAKAYCGLEAYFETPSGRSATFYLIDGFDQKWVRTATSVDIPVGVFPQVLGRYTRNKNDVVTQGAWKFTGKRSNKFLYRNRS